MGLGLEFGGVESRAAGSELGARVGCEDEIEVSGWVTSALSAISKTLYAFFWLEASC